MLCLWIEEEEVVNNGIRKLREPILMKKEAYGRFSKNRLGDRKALML